MATDQNGAKICDEVLQERHDQINERNLKTFERVEAEHTEFIEKWKTGICYICNKRLDTLERAEPCLHWFLAPVGIRKNHFRYVFEKFGFSELNAYLRWVANSETLAKNINDLVEERSSSKKVETTIFFKNKEWALSCSDSDFVGHKTSRFGNRPHYHLQMRIDGKPFINFGDFHIRLTDYDIYVIGVMNGEYENVRHHSGPGCGMEEFMKHDTPENILSSLSPSYDEKKAAVHVTYVITADPGTTIPAAKICDLVRKSREEKKTLINYAEEIPNAKFGCIMSPGDGVPEMTKRSKRKR